ncbi:MAG: TonB-dependent receptor [Sphingobium sp.]|nr:TonB-dependent receptor [Sphingobium sp.]
MKNNPLRLALLSATALSGLVSIAAHAADAAPGDATPAAANAEDNLTIVVTATRRSVTLEDVPINISAASGEMLAEKRIDTVRDLAAFTPGLTVRDTGTTGATIVMRGLTTADAGGNSSNTSNSEAIYFGETPMYIDMKFLDLNRVETLLGPQGTLYGLGTMFGAIRYIPNRPSASKWEGSVHARVFGESHSGNPGWNVDATINIPIIEDKVAFRGSVGYWNNPGFIDYTALVNQPGISNPQPGGLLGNPADEAGSLNYYINSKGKLRFEHDIIGVNPTTGAPNSAWFGSLGTPQQISANLHTKNDANDEQTISTRAQLGLYPTEWLRIYGSWMHQVSDSGASQSNTGGVFGTGNYVSTKRFLNPTHRIADLYSVEMEVDIGGFAQLVSDTAWTKQLETDFNDNTDLLLDLNYDYELFPNFVSFNTRTGSRTSFNQELRLVSKHSGPLNWVIGGFYNLQNFHSQYHEETPGFNAWAQVNVPGVYGLRNDDYEYASISNSRKDEKAIFGEATFNFTDKWQITGGARYYHYGISTQGGSTLPMFDGPFVGDPQYSPGAINIPLNNSFAGQNGFVWKGNTSYKFSRDLMVYLTVSKGYRLGGANTSAVPCTDAILNGTGQKLCLLPDEQFYGPDTTLNKELGIRFGLFNGKLRGSLAVFHINWDGIQVPGNAVNGASGITVNGSTAVSKGVELSFAARPARGLTINGSYSYTDAQITADIKGLVAYGIGGTAKTDAKSGDRLAGSPMHSGALGVTYELPVNAAGDTVTLNWTATYTGDIYSRIGLRGFAQLLPGYLLNRASVGYKFKDHDFQVNLYVDNIFDKYAVTGVSNDRANRIINDGIVSRYYQQSVLTPRRFGLEVTKNF